MDENPYEAPRETKLQPPPLPTPTAKRDWWHLVYIGSSAGGVSLFSDNYSRTGSKLSAAFVVLLVSMIIGSVAMLIQPKPGATTVPNLQDCGAAHYSLGAILHFLVR